MFKSTPDQRRNAVKFQDQWLRLIHPLLIPNDKIGLPKYQYTEKVTVLDDTVKKVTEELLVLTGHVWVVYTTKAGTQIALRLLRFDTEDSDSIISVEVNAQNIVECLQPFGGCYGRTNEGWILLIPDIQKVDPTKITEVYQQRQKQNWMFISRRSRDFACFNIPDSLIKSPTKEDHEQSNQTISNMDMIIKSIPAMTEEGLSALNNSFNVGHSTTNISYVIPEYLTPWVVRAICDYCDDNGVEYELYSNMRADPCLHPQIRRDAEASATAEKKIAKERIANILRKNHAMSTAEKNQLLDTYKSMQDCEVLMIHMAAGLIHQLYQKAFELFEKNLKMGCLTFKEGQFEIVKPLYRIRGG